MRPLDVERDSPTLGREALAIEAAHRIDSDGVVSAVERLVASRGALAHLRMDNGSRLTAAALRD